MDFELTKEQRMTQEMVREFAQREIAPEVQKSDEFASYNRSFLSKMGRLGVFGLCIPKRYGGSGFDYNTLAIACEELEKVDTGARLTLTTHVASFAMTLLQWGTPEQKNKYLIPAAKGQLFGAFALSESQAGTDVRNLMVTARREGDYYILNGTKMWVALIDVADVFLVFARMDTPNSNQAISCFIVERSFPGVQTESIHGKMYVRLANTGQLILNNVPVPLENLLGFEGEGLSIALSSIDHGRFSSAAGAVGVIQGCLEASVKYARKRYAFGQPIGKFQLIQSMIAEMAADAEISRLLVYKVGWLKNEGRRCTRETALAKWYACDKAFKAAANAMQIHGAYAYFDSFPLERYLRNAKGAMIYTGTSEIQEIIMAEYALGFREDKPLRKELPPWQFEEV
ncbi:MAG: acyl-CoA dehydrogenase family protein [Firmicutes bacterium]|nr:acyl-CoA dehydrogenase family protein [Bacillota bacterium]